MKFDLPKDQSSIIKVIGVGGGGSNAVNHMYSQGITGVDFVICNTDQQALDLSPIPNKIQLGVTLTEGRGAGSNPEVGKNSAIESVEEIKEILSKNTKMAFITAGMGGGTGTGAAPIIAKAAKEMGILTIGIVTVPFSFEGRRRKLQAEKGLEEMRQNVDTLLIINNDKLREMYGNLRMSEAFAKADDVLTVAAKGIAEIITVPGYINVDFEDVKTVMKDGGTAIMGSAYAEGENRAIKAVSQAMASPLLNDNDITGANYILLNITSGTDEITMDEIDEITEYIQNESGYTADIIWGNGTDESLGEKISVTVIATGFGSKNPTGFGIEKEPQKVVRTLDEDVPVVITKKVEDTNAQETTEVKNEQEDESVDFKLIIKEPTEQSPVNETPKEEPKNVVRFSLDDDDEVIEQKRKQITEEIPAASNINEQKEEYTGANTVNESNQTETVNETPNPLQNRLTEEEMLKKSKERIMRLKALTSRMKSPAGLSDLEKEPAYKRRNITLENTPHSSESNVSRYTISDDEDNTPKLRDNNSFLHDNVD
jgi:cell division protein FtsZ